MSAEEKVREYREATDDSHYPDKEWWLDQLQIKADAAIAALEAEAAALKAENRRLQVGWDCAELAVILKDGLKKWAEAEVERLRRIVNHIEWHPDDGYKLCYNRELVEPILRELCNCEPRTGLHVLCPAHAELDKHPEWD